MISIPVDATVSAAAAAIAFGISVYMVVGVRFEAPFVLYSFALFARLVGTGAAFAYPPAAGRYLPLLPDGDLGFLIFYPILIGALRFAARAYGKKGSGDTHQVRRVLLVSIPLAFVDAARFAWLLSARQIPYVPKAHFPSLPTLPPGLWGALSAVGIGAFVAGLWVSRRRKS